MKYIYFTLFIFILDKTGIVESKGENELTVEPIDYGSEKTYYTAGVRKSIICKGVSKNQKVEWIDPSGRVVSRHAAKRVFTQEHFVPSTRSRIPALVLIFTRALVDDTGVWKCQSGDVHHEVSICIIDPAEFVNTPTEVTVDHGRSITLSCQAKGEPEPRINWYRNGEIITDESNSMKYKVSSKFSNDGFEGLLTIISLESEDSGLYTCKAVQQSSSLEECFYHNDINISLHVNWGKRAVRSTRDQPVFEDGNDTTLVPVKDNESVDLVCSAKAHPAPKYRWFKDVGDMLSEYSQNEIQIQEEKAILTVTANKTTFGQRYICRATNKYGAVEKVFELHKMGSPEKPNDVNVTEATHNELIIKVTWTDFIKFPINEIHVQYIESNDMTNDSQSQINVDWSLANNMTMKDVVLSRIENSHSTVLVELKDLKENTEYLIRLSASNEVGVSSWSDILVASTSKSEEAEIPEELNSEDTPEPSGGTVYGIFFALGICVVAIAYMFAIRCV